MSVNIWRYKPSRTFGVIWNLRYHFFKRHIWALKICNFLGIFLSDSILKVYTDRIHCIWLFANLTMLLNTEGNHLIHRNITSNQFETYFTIECLLLCALPWMINNRKILQLEFTNIACERLKCIPFSAYDLRYQCIQSAHSFEYI